MSRALVVKATHADDDPERANLACAIAATGVVSGLDVAMFLAVDGVALALPDIGDRISVAHAPPIAELLDGIYAGGRMIVCAPCAQRRGLTPADFREGTEMAAAAAFVELATAPETTALVY